MAPQGYPHPHEDSTRAPMEVLVGTVGQEGEYSRGNLAPWLAAREYAPPDGSLHAYQCTCRERNNYLVHPTSDCTAHGGEYVIGGARGVLFGSDTYIAASGALADAVQAERACISNEVGLHTHVGWQKQDGTDMTEHEMRRLVRNYVALEDQIRVLAAGAFRRVRTQAPILELRYITDMPSGGRPSAEWYRQPVENLTFPLPGRPTLNFHTSKNTIEFRVWNAARSQWRMVMAASVSVAMVEAACQGREVAGPGEMDLTDHLHDLLPLDVLGLIERQRTFQAAFGTDRA